MGYFPSFLPLQVGVEFDKIKAIKHIQTAQTYLLLIRIQILLGGWMYFADMVIMLMTIVS